MNIFMVANCAEYTSQILIAGLGTAKMIQVSVVVAACMTLLSCFRSAAWQATAPVGETWGVC
jgi:hypothetical protein